MIIPTEKECHEEREGGEKDNEFLTLLMPNEGVSTCDLWTSDEKKI